MNTQQEMTIKDFDMCFAFDQAEFQHKCESYAQMFFFCETPDKWSYSELIEFLQKQEGGFDEIADMEDLVVWEPFEEFNPQWVADQMNMMVMQLKETFK